MGFRTSTPCEYLINRPTAIRISGILDADSTVPWEDDTNQHPQGTILGQSSNDDKYWAVKGSALDGTSASGQKVVPVAYTTPFATGDGVTLLDISAGTSETDTIASISEGTSITMTANNGADYASGDYVFVTGSYTEGTAVAILDAEVNNRNEDGDGEDTPIIVVVKGTLKSGALDWENTGTIDQLQDAGFTFVEVD